MKNCKTTPSNQTESRIEIMSHNCRWFSSRWLLCFGADLPPWHWPSFTVWSLTSTRTRWKRSMTWPEWLMAASVASPGPSPSLGSYSHASRATEVLSIQFNSTQLVTFLEPWLWSEQVSSMSCCRGGRSLRWLASLTASTWSTWISSRSSAIIWESPFSTRRSATLKCTLASWWRSSCWRSWFRWRSRHLFSTWRSWSSTRRGAEFSTVIPTIHSQLVLADTCYLADDPSKRTVNIHWNWCSSSVALGNNYQFYSTINLSVIFNHAKDTVNQHHGIRSWINWYSSENKPQ